MIPIGKAFLDRQEIEKDILRMEHFTTLAHVLVEYLSGMETLPSTDELLNIFGMVGLYL